MARLTKRIVDAADVREADRIIWDDDLSGFGLRVFKSGKRSYLVQYRASGRTRRYTIGPHGVWTPETARREARAILGRIALGENPSEQRRLDHKAITVKELCDRYIEDAENGLILGKGRRPKKASTLTIDKSRIRRHIIPLLGTRRVKDLVSSDIVRFIRDVTSGKTKADMKTKPRGRAIVRGGAGTASRATALLGGILTYAREHGIINVNPVHGVRKPADRAKERRLSIEEYRELGRILRRVSTEDAMSTAATIIRFVALTGCRRSEAIGLKWREIDPENSCLRLLDSKEGASMRPVGLAVLNLTDGLRRDQLGTYVFPGTVDDKPLISFPKRWKTILRATALDDVTPHVLRHSFASIANDLGFTEATVAALLGHSRGTITSRYIHTVDAALVMAADTVAGFINGLLDGAEFRRTSYILDRKARATALERLFKEGIEESETAREALAA